MPKTGEGFIDFIGQVHKTKEQFGQDGPITVHCRYTDRDLKSECKCGQQNMRMDDIQSADQQMIILKVY